MTQNDTDSVGFVETRTDSGGRIGSSRCRWSAARRLGPIDVAYETYGQLNEAGDNAILICHALSGNAHVAGYNHPEDKKPGWWEGMVGPGKGIDTNKYFVICSNFLGGCSGTTGPCSVNPETGRPYGLDFPIITIADMVRVQKLLLDKLGVKHLLAVIGGSIGGMQVLQWSIAYPEMMDAAIPIATTTHLGAQSIAFDAVGRSAILSDAHFADGQYHNGEGPGQGLAIARMIGHITYLSEQGMRQKFGRELRGADKYSYDFNSEFAVETYLDHQGQSVRRAVRRQQLSVHHQGIRLLRPAAGLRLAERRVRPRAGPLPRGQLQQRLALHAPAVRSDGRCPRRQRPGRELLQHRLDLRPRCLPAGGWHSWAASFRAS